MLSKTLTNNEMISLLFRNVTNILLLLADESLCNEQNEKERKKKNKTLFLYKIDEE